MQTREEAIKIIRETCSNVIEIKLCVSDYAASWDEHSLHMTPNHWKQIGYVSALAFAFDIKEVN